MRRFVQIPPFPSAKIHAQQGRSKASFFSLGRQTWMIGAHTHLAKNFKAKTMAATFRERERA